MDVLHVKEYFFFYFIHCYSGWEENNPDDVHVEYWICIYRIITMMTINPHKIPYKAERIWPGSVIQSLLRLLDLVL
jgi:hypothetical protein